MAAIMTVRQAAELDHAFERNNFTSRDLKLLSSGANLTKVLHLLRGCGELSATGVVVNRKEKFNPTTFIGREWSILEEDSRSVVRDSVSFSDPYFDYILKANIEDVDRENGMRREERFAHLCGTDLVRPDARILQTLIDNPYLIPEKWKERVRFITQKIYFYGTVLKAPAGAPCVLYLNWSRDRWNWCVGQIGGSELSLTSESPLLGPR